MTGATGDRRHRVARLGQLAAEQEEQARARFQRAADQVIMADRQRERALEGAAGLASQHLSPALRGHLADVGARHLMRLADEKADMVVDVDRRRAELAQAATRTRSLERLVDRLAGEEHERRTRRDAAVLQDLVAIRAARTDRTDRTVGRGVR